MAVLSAVSINHKLVLKSGGRNYKKDATLQIQRIRFRTTENVTGSRVQPNNKREVTLVRVRGHLKGETKGCLRGEKQRGARRQRPYDTVHNKGGSQYKERGCVRVVFGYGGGSGKHPSCGGEEWWWWRGDGGGGRGGSSSLCAPAVPSVQGSWCV